MKSFLKALGAFLPHLVIALSLTLLTLSITDHFNTAMAFINHPMTKRLILIYCLISLCVCLTVLARWMDGRIIRSVLPLICTIMTVVMLVALFYDWFYPREILFAKITGKTLIFVNTMVSLVNAAYTAAADRSRAMKDYKKRRRKQ